MESVGTAPNIPVAMKTKFPKKSQKVPKEAQRVPKEDQKVPNP
jgi:hypothetical protein